MRDYHGHGLSSGDCFSVHRGGITRLCIAFPSFLPPLLLCPHSMDPYDRLVWEVWMPRLRQLISSWSPRACNSLVDFLEHWKPHLPGWVLENILDQLVLPKIQNEVEVWDPTTDVMPIHKWVHPWLPLMGTLGKGSYSILIEGHPHFKDV